MIAVFTILLVLMLAMAILRIATVALVLTGLSQQLAAFQARSAFFGVGFTTRESEDVVNHPVRRRIITTLMLCGQIGIITMAASLIGSIIETDPSSGWAGSIFARMLLLALGALGLLWLSYSRHVDAWVSRSITWALKRWTTLEARDYAWLLRMSRDYGVSELHVAAEDWVAGRTLAQLELAKEGLLVLGVERATGRYIGAPRGDTVVHAGDTLILYGRQDALTALDVRRAGVEGNIHHVIAVTTEIDVEENERKEDVGPSS